MFFLVATPGSWASLSQNKKDKGGVKEPASLRQGKKKIIYYFFSFFFIYIIYNIYIKNTAAAGGRTASKARLRKDEVPG